MADSQRYRLHAIDGRPLPVALRYDEERCVVTGGTLLLTDDVTPLGDGHVEWELFGEIAGLPGPNAAAGIFWLGEEFDRLDARHLTFPGGFRKRDRAPELLVTHSTNVLEIAPVAPEAPVGGVERHFGARTWQFRAVEPSEAPDRVAEQAR